MKVLSLFDWIACGYEALLRAGIVVDRYYASEIDKYAIQVATTNHPDIVEIGDVTKVNGKEYDCDILIWGSPCTNLSNAGNGKWLEWEQSKLFFEYVRILKETKPKYFLLENVKMKKEWSNIMSDYLFWIQPVLIDSSLVSAQHRERLYRVGRLSDDWETYIQVDIPQPEDKKIMLKDVIIQWDVDEQYYLTERQLETIRRNLNAKWKQLTPIESMIEKMTFPSRIKQISNDWLNIKCPTLCSVMWTWGWNVPCVIQKVGDRDKCNYWMHTDKSYCLPANAMSDRWQLVIVRWRPHMPYEKGERYLDYKWYEDKCPTLTVNCATWDQSNIVAQGVAIRNQLVKGNLETQINVHDDEKSNCVVSSYSDKLNMVAIAYAPGSREFENQWFKTEKSPTLCARDYKDPKIIFNHPENQDSCILRKLTPEECERLQTVREWYTSGVSKTQRYKQLWNWWTVDVIVHILKNLLK